MREIKFRYFDYENKKISIYEPVRFEEDHLWKWEDVNRDDNSWLMQYTGLKDKNGKEIYEGDIVKVPNNGISEVKWNYGEWNVEDFSNNAGSNNIYNFLQKDIEIIGNIYENPELLTQ